jgi:hypothetical protein
MWYVFVYHRKVSICGMYLFIVGRQVICFMIVEVYDLCGKCSCSCIILLHHAHSCHEHMHRARSVRKSYDYSGVLLWIMSLTYGHDRTGTTSYIA